MRSLQLQLALEANNFESDVLQQQPHDLQPLQGHDAQRQLGGQVLEAAAVVGEPAEERCPRLGRILEALLARGQAECRAQLQPEAAHDRE